MTAPNSSVLFEDILHHYPEIYQEPQSELAVPHSGKVFLVAACMLGKIYCKWIKDAGGIALDIGSAVDFWCGYETRGMDEASHYCGPADTMDRVKELAAHDPRVARLVGQQGV